MIFKTAILLATACSALGATLNVPGTANPWLAGMTNGFSESSGDVTPGESPVLFTNFVSTISITAGAQLRFAVSGSAGFAPGAESGPEGADQSFVSHPAELGIGGINNSLANALLGVFLDDSQLDPSAPTPAPYDFASADSRNYLALRPKLNQPFYIGDGVTTNGVPQIVVAPSRATRLFLGITDGSGWYNNTGSFAVDITLAPTLPDMGPFDYSTGGTPAYSNNSWQFSAFYSAPPTDLKLRVQFLLSPCSGTCVYMDLPGNAYMNRVTPGGKNWILNTTDVPSGDVFFQVVASAAGYLNIISPPQGPVTVLGPAASVQLPAISSFSVNPGGAPIRSTNPWQFGATYSTAVSGLQLRVQSTLTPSNEGSWTDLPGNPYMTNVGANWTLNTTDVPTGVRHFRVIASAPGYLDTSLATNPNNPFTVLGGLTPVTYPLTFASNPTDGGSIAPSPAPGADGNYAEGTAVTLIATANQGYYLQSWTGEDSTGIPFSPDVAQVVMSGPRNVTASFTLNSANTDCGCPIECLDFGFSGIGGFSGIMELSTIQRRITLQQAPPGNQIDLALLRTFRDQVLARTTQGQAIIDIFYKFSPEIIFHLATSTNVRSAAGQAILNLQPVLRDLVAGTGELTVSSNQVSAVVALIDKLNEVAGVELKSALQIYCDQEDSLESLIGKSSAQARLMILGIQLQIVNPKINSTGGLEFIVTGILPSGTLHAEYSDDLAKWNVLSLAPVTTLPATVRDDRPLATKQRYYRVVNAP
jgi:Divergent InlB B-repeat domain